MNNACKIINFTGKTVLEIGCGCGDLLQAIATQWTPRYIVGIDNHLDQWNTTPAQQSNWRIAKGDACSLQYPDHFFDVVISVGVFEHIRDLRKAFSEIQRVLKPGGQLYTEFSPIWSSITGHHYNFWLEEEAGLVPGWGHLWMNEAEMMSYLEPLIGKERAINACFEIYQNNHINRLTRKEYYEIFLTSGLLIRKLKEHICYSSLYMFRDAEPELTNNIYSKLKNNHPLNELGVLGFSLHMEKPAIRL